MDTAINLMNTLLTSINTCKYNVTLIQNRTVKTAHKGLCPIVLSIEHERPAVFIGTECSSGELPSTCTGAKIAVNTSSLIMNKGKVKEICVGGPCRTNKSVKGHQMTPPHTAK
jgi:hypothetical protein